MTLHSSLAYKALIQISKLNVRCVIYTYIYLDLHLYIKTLSYKSNQCTTIDFLDEFETPLREKKTQNPTSSEYRKMRTRSEKERKEQNLMEKRYLMNENFLVDIQFFYSPVVEEKEFGGQ
jgi:hypothetical protein